MNTPNWKTITHSLIVLRGLAYEHVDERYRNAASELKAELLLLYNATKLPEPESLDGKPKLVHWRVVRHADTGRWYLWRGDPTSDGQGVEWTTVAEVDVEVQNATFQMPLPQKPDESDKEYADRLLHFIRGDRALITGLKAEHRDEENEFREALAPFAFFSRQWHRKPMRNIDDVIYAIHSGTEYEAELRRSHMDRAAELVPEDHTDV